MEVCGPRSRREANLLTYGEGCYLLLGTGSQPSQVRCTDGPGRAWFAPDQRAILIELLLGASERCADVPAVQRLLRHHLVRQAASGRDRSIEQRLATLEADWRWQRPRATAGCDVDRLHRASLQAHARRKVFLSAFGQTPCLPETAVRRALLAAGPRRRVLCVGDDDLVSVPLALLGHQVDVVDIDGEILIAFLQRLARRGRLPLCASMHDLAQPVPARAIGSYDLVYTDPISTRDGFALFLSRAVSYLGPDGRIFCCVHAAAVEVLADVAAAMRLELCDWLADFNRYYDDMYQVDRYRSDLVVLQRTARSRPLYAPTAVAPADIFRGVARYRQHGWGEVRVLPGRPLELAALAERLASVLTVGNGRTGAGAIHQTAAGLVALVALPGSGHLALDVAVDGGRLAVSVLPFDDGRDSAIFGALVRALAPATAEAAHQVVAPDRRLLARSSACPERCGPIL